MLVGIWLVKAVLMRSQVEMSNTLLETGRTAILIIKWQRTWLNCVHVLVFCSTVHISSWSPCLWPPQLSSIPRIAARMIFLKHESHYVTPQSKSLCFSHSFQIKLILIRLAYEAVSPWTSSCRCLHSFPLAHLYTSPREISQNYL